MKRPADIDTRMLELFNRVDDPEVLISMLAPRSTDDLLEASVYMVLARRKARAEGRFSDSKQLQEAFPHDHHFEGLLDAARCAPWDCHPMLLMPLRLETRFTDEHLLVRIYPDTIFNGPNQLDPSEEEYAAIRTYGEQPASEERAAWRLLSSRVGPRRAAWLVRWAEGHDFDGAPPEFRTSSFTSQPDLKLLPDRFCVFAYRYGSIVHQVETAPVRSDSTLIAPFTGDANSLFDQRSEWMHDFDAALRDGFAVRIELGHQEPDLGFERIVAVGMKHSKASDGAVFLAELFDCHHYGSGLGFPALDEPTNNTEDEPSAHCLEPDHDAAYFYEIDRPSGWEDESSTEPRTCGHRLGHALGIDPDCFTHVEGAGRVTDSHAGDMNRVIWRATGDYYLRNLLSGAVPDEYLEHVGEHVLKYVRPGGPLPTIRVGKQPYGVLPVTRVRRHAHGGWLPSPRDCDEEDDTDRIASALRDAALHQIVEMFFERWKEYAENPRRVPRIGPEWSDAAKLDPDENLLRILSMEPRSVTFRARPFVDEDFVAAMMAVLRDFVFGENTAYADSGLEPLDWMKKWSKTWDGVQENVAELLAKLTRPTSAQELAQRQDMLLQQPLLKILGWWEGEDEPVGMVWDPDDPTTSPTEYLGELCGGPNTSSSTLLAEMASRALKLGGVAEFLELEKSICRLASLPVIDCCNAAAGPEPLARKFDLGAARRGERPDHAKSLKKAQKILSHRTALGGRFTSQEELAAISVLGPEAMLDLVASAPDSPDQLNLDRLYRESLDLSSHRVDAWVTSFAYKRLLGMRAQFQSGIHLGAYGFVEDLRPRDDLPSEGYIHAPSANHAAAAAVLYNGFLTHDPALTSNGEEGQRKDNPMRINLTSQRVRHGLRVLEGIRQGQPLGALIGYRFERALQDHALSLEQHIHDFREQFPLVAHKLTQAQTDESVEAVAAHNVVDGVALIAHFRDHVGTEGLGDSVTSLIGGAQLSHVEALAVIISELDDSVDALGDLLLTESVYQAVQGNYERAGAALDAASGNATPPELESVVTPVSGRSLTHRVCLLFNKCKPSTGTTGIPDDPRGAAEPRITAWFDSLMGNMGTFGKNIGIAFDFWERETTPDSLDRVDINQADIEEIEQLSPLSAELASAIAEERSSERGPFKHLADLARVPGMDAQIISRLRLLAMTGYVERIDVNRASREDLASNPATDFAAAAIAEARDARPFERLADLKRVDGINDKELEELRPFVTTGRTEMALSELSLSAADFLYLAQVPPEGEESELEQRIARIVRDEFGLPASQRIEIDPNHSGPFEHCLADAVEMARQALRLLASGSPMKPESLCHPGEVKGSGYRRADYEELEERVGAAARWLSNPGKFRPVNPRIPGLLQEMNRLETRSRVRLLIEGLPGFQIKPETTFKHDPTGTIWKPKRSVKIRADGTAQVTATILDAGPPIAIPATAAWSLNSSTLLIGFKSVRSIEDSFLMDRDEVIELLEKATRFGIAGAYPPARDDPQLAARFENVRVEIQRRVAGYNRLYEKIDLLNEELAALGPEAAAAASHAPQVRLLLDAAKVLFGKSFVVLPTFAPFDPGGWNRAAEQDVLNGHGEDRLLLWLQQAAEVRPAVACLEDSLMMGEAWLQSTRRGEGPNLSLNVSQLPHTPERHWLGLSVHEGAERRPAPGWNRSPLSVVAAVHGPTPKFKKEPLLADDRVVTAGLVLDNWNELIPAQSEEEEPTERINTSEKGQPTERINTSVAFHYDAPSNQAPQSLLLAVPSQVKPEPGLWTHRDLADIVTDTMDLAKVRMVDLDALAPDPDPEPGRLDKPIGGIMPGIYLPTDKDNPGWDRDLVMQSFEEWVDALTPLTCVAFDELPLGLLENDIHIGGYRIWNSGDADHSHFVFPAWFAGSDEEMHVLSANHQGPIAIDLQQEYNFVQVTLAGGWNAGPPNPPATPLTDRTRAVRVHDTAGDPASPDAVLGPHLTIEFHDVRYIEPPYPVHSSVAHTITLSGAPMQYVDIMMGGLFQLVRICVK